MKKTVVARFKNPNSISCWRYLHLYLFLLLVAGITGCQKDPKAQKEKFLKDMVAAFGSQKSDLIKLSNGLYEDMRVYRDGKRDVIVFDRKLAKVVELDDPELREFLISKIKENKSSKKTLELGIQLRFIDRLPDGKIAREFTVDQSDL